MRIQINYLSTTGANVTLHLFHSNGGVYMKTYIVGVNRAAGEVLLRAFESKDIWNSNNPNGLTYQQILPNYFDNYYESTNKRQCVRFIKANFSGFEVYDQSDHVIRQDPNFIR